jgi:hypothetical protein
MIEQAGIDEYDTLPGDTNSEYKNQFLEFLRKNRPTEEQPKPKEIKIRKRKRKTADINLEEI